MVLKDGIEPSIQSYQDCVIPFNYKSIWCLWQDSNLHTPAYLAGALARYKLASLPLSYRGNVWQRV